MSRRDMYHESGTTPGDEIRSINLELESRTIRQLNLETAIRELRVRLSAQFLNLVR